ncbi:MAG: ABC transporter permease [Aurantimonas endophytica]|uniref:ABC transporter permease n=1 Tax=Aurantimonas endophytica TaxID=1522175 RepID=UPI0030025DEA
MLISLWRYRYFIASSIRSDLKGRFARSKLGALWFVLHPLAQALIFAIVLSEVLGARLPDTDNDSAYAIYLLSGMAAWSLFAEILNRSITIFLEQAGAMKKIAFPRLCLPVVVWGSALVNHVLLVAAILVVFAFLGHFPGAALLVLPLGIVLISAFAFGIGVLCGTLNVFSRDVAQVMSVVLQLWFWLTPVVYPANIVPENLRWVVELNPMVPLVQIYQNALLHNLWPDPVGLIYPAVAAVVAVALSFVVFRRASPELVDAL